MTIIIPSKSASNLVPCIKAIRDAGEIGRIILVDDGISVGYEHGPFLFKSEYEYVYGAKPFIYARNCNLGIMAAGKDDVLLLNDDALLQTRVGFSLMALMHMDNPGYGLIGATCNNVGNTNQWPQNIGLREEPRMVCFVAVFIPRSTIKKIGLLDERFKGYGCEDDDYCLRVRKAGLKIGIYDGCYVDHGSLKSSFRGEAGAGGDYRPNLELFRAKWGAGNHDL